MELDLERLYQVAPARMRTRPISRYPVAQRDLAVVVAAETPAGRRWRRPFARSGGALAPEVRLFDVYTGEGIAPKARRAWPIPSPIARQTAR